MTPTEQQLREALEAASPIVSDMAAGGRKITRPEDAKRVWQQIREALAAPPSLPVPTEQQSSAVPVANYADFQQRRGAMADIVDEAIAAFDQFMLDDDFDSQAALERIIGRMRERKALYASHPPAEAPEKTTAVAMPSLLREAVKVSAPEKPPLPELIVYKNGRPAADQKAALEEFKQACAAPSQAAATPEQQDNIYSIADAEGIAAAKRFPPGAVIIRHGTQAAMPPAAQTAPAIPAHLLEFVEAVATNHTFLDHYNSAHCNSCNADEGNGEKHKPDCIVLRAQAILGLSRASLAIAVPSEIARAEETSVGAHLYVHGVCVNTWLGTMHYPEACELAAQVNTAALASPSADHIPDAGNMVSAGPLSAEQLADLLPATATVLEGEPRKVCMTFAELRTFARALARTAPEGYVMVPKEPK